MFTIIIFIVMFIDFYIFIYIYFCYFLGIITLYKIDKYIDISKGPMIANTGQIGRVAVTSVHKLQGKLIIIRD